MLANQVYFLYLAPTEVKFHGEAARARPSIGRNLFLTRYTCLLSFKTIYMGSGRIVLFLTFELDVFLSPIHSFRYARNRIYGSSMRILVQATLCTIGRNGWVAAKVLLFLGNPRLVVSTSGDNYCSRLDWLHETTHAGRLLAQ